MRIQRLCVVALVPLVGCASITGSEMQTVSVTTAAPDKALVDKAHCSLKNDKGVWEVTSPGFVMIHRSAEDLDVVCKKDGSPDGLLKAISRASGGMFGNIVFGGGIGAIIDHEKGTGYNYPDKLPVVMGSSVVIDRGEEDRARQPDKTAAKN
jgi:hypothetical protein